MPCQFIPALLHTADCRLQAAGLRCPCKSHAPAGPSPSPAEPQALELEQPLRRLWDKRKYAAGVKEATSQDTPLPRIDKLDKALRCIVETKFTVPGPGPV